MNDMAKTEAMEIELAGAMIRGMLQLPQSRDNGHAVPAIMICRGIYPASEDSNSLFDELTKSLNADGIALLTFEHRCADLILDDFDAHCANHDAQDAQAALEWLKARREIDANRIGVLGYSLGAIAATALARHNSEIARVCLLAPTTAASLAGHLTKSNGVPASVNPEHLPASFLPSLASIDSGAELAHHDRPTLILHGAADRTIPPDVSREYSDAMAEKSKSNFERVLIARGNHTFSSPEVRATCVELIRQFFTAMVSERAAQPALSGT